MLMFQSPPPTRYDLRFSIAGIPVRVHPVFWLLTLLLGATGDLILIPIWLLVVFISILVHELGHAFAFRRYGQRSHIVLHFAGGLTIPETTYWGSGVANVYLSPNQNIFISLAGPGAGFLLAALVIIFILVTGGSIGTAWLLGILPLPLRAELTFGGRILELFVTLMLYVNIFWGLVNLLPVFPLDGGQVVRNILIQYDPMNGVRKSLWLSTIVGGIFALIGLISFGSIFIALMFGLLAFQSYQSLRGRSLGF